jgi:hypothetical protein
MKSVQLLYENKDLSDCPTMKHDDWGNNRSAVGDDSKSGNPIAGVSKKDMFPSVPNLAAEKNYIPLQP